MTADPIPDEADETLLARRAYKGHNRAQREAELGLPPRPNLRRGERRELPDLRWQVFATCAGADDLDVWALTEAISQQDAADVIEVFCVGCPVRAACLEAGRSSLAWGVWGGYVLTDGWLAPQAARPTEHRPSGPRADPTHDAGRRAQRGRDAARPER